MLGLPVWYRPDEGLRGATWLVELGSRQHRDEIEIRARLLEPIYRRGNADGRPDNQTYHTPSVP